MFKLRNKSGEKKEDHKKGADPVPVQLHITITFMEKKGLALALKMMRFSTPKNGKQGYVRL